MGESDEPHELNGQAVKPKRKASAKKTSEPKASRIPAVAVEGSGKGGQEEDGGRVLTEKDIKQAEFFLRPWFPRGMLSLIAGAPNVGKSSFLAWIVSRAKRACILPGSEESVQVMTLPRFIANGVDLKSVRWLDKRKYTFPKDGKVVMKMVRDWGADLLVADPIGCYMEPGKSENSGQDVREFLESFHFIGEETGASIAGVRHPGKDPNNPMPGSREWMAVPRSVVLLMSDGGVPPRLMIKHRKDSFGQSAPPFQYILDGEKGKPRRFVLLESLDSVMTELSSRHEGPVARRKVMDACQVIRDMFASEAEPSVEDLVSKCKALGIGEHARDDAKIALGIMSKKAGFSEKYIMIRTQKEWPAWLPGAENAK